MITTILLYIAKAYLIWVLLCVLLFVLDQLYGYLTVRTVIIQLRSIVSGRIIIDSELNDYNILTNHILGCNNLHSKILKLRIDSCYKIKIYGYNTPLTKVNLIDIENS